MNFDANKKYPLAFLIHGGPESAWNPNWHYRWNPQIYSNAGYVAVLINPHGSVGMGIEFTDKVRKMLGLHKNKDKQNKQNDNDNNKKKK